MAHEHDWVPVVNVITAAMRIPHSRYSCSCGAVRKKNWNGTKWLVREFGEHKWKEE